jgi:hypothetical protein
MNDLNISVFALHIYTLYNMFLLVNCLAYPFLKVAVPSGEEAVIHGTSVCGSCGGVSHTTSWGFLTSLDAIFILFITLSGFGLEVLNITACMDIIFKV